MGLDCTAVSKLVHVGRHDMPEGYCEEDGHWTAFCYEGQEYSMRGLLGVGESMPGNPDFVGGRCYAETAESQSFGFRAGSYGGYGVFRSALAELRGFKVEEYWDGTADRDEPFYEIVNFADNEGTIGPEAAADLLEDFRQHRDLFHQGWPEWAGAYDDWIVAFGLAADGGLVSFH